jgi:hypothetical protein
MEYKEHYSNSSNNDIEREAQDIASIVYDYEIIIKVFLVIILIYTFISNIFTISSELINDNLKLYAFISLMIILYVLYKLDIISLLKLLVILIFASFIAASIYYNLQKLEFIILFYYSFNYQLEKIYNETKTNYNEVLFSFIFIAIISIISIVLYWDNIYTDAKKLSKCGKIINTIENNNKNKKPFIYNIIIINNDLIDTTTSKYILKITYDFMKKKTIVDYGTDDGNYNDGSESFKKQGYISLYNKETNSLSELENDNEEKKNIEEKNRNRFQFQYNKAERIEKEAESYLDNFKKVEDAKILKSIEDKQADVNSAENALKELWIKYIKYLIKDIIDREKDIIDREKNIENIEKNIENIKKELNIVEKEEKPKADKEWDAAKQQRDGLGKRLQEMQNELEKLELEKKNAQSDKEKNDISAKIDLANSNYISNLALYEKNVKTANEKWNIMSSTRNAIDEKNGKLIAENTKLDIANQELETAITAITAARDNKERFTKRDNFKDNGMIQYAISTLNNAKAELEIYRIRKYCELASGVAQINEKIANARANKNAILIAQNRVDDRLKIIEDDYNFNREKNQENKDILTDIIGREESNDKEKLYYYFNLRTMKSEKIENIDANILTEERFKYILVDDNNNKLPYDETAQDLIKFTKIYSKNEKYNINIINDIFYAKNNREKLFI